MIHIEVYSSFDQKGLNKRFEQVMDNTLHEIAERLCEDSQKQVPVDTGALRDSAFIHKQEDGNDSLAYVVGYAKDYAKKQHEHLNYFHRQGKAKFLEDPFLASQETMLQKISKVVHTVVDEVL